MKDLRTLIKQNDEVIKFTSSLMEDYASKFLSHGVELWTRLHLYNGVLSSTITLISDSHVSDSGEEIRYYKEISTSRSFDAVDYKKKLVDGLEECLSEIGDTDYFSDITRYNETL